MPSVAPDRPSHALLRREVNVRASAIPGFVVAGGVGRDLRAAISWGPGRFDEAAIFPPLFAAVVALDRGSSALRDRLSHGASP